MTALRLIDALSTAASRIAQLMLVALVGAMIYEVAARYLFNSPTIWAFDLSYMATGAVFLLGAAWTARIDGHVRVDFFSSRLPQRIQSVVQGLIYLLAMAPIFGGLAWAAWRRTIGAFVSGEVDTVSIWAPPMWPFFSISAIGLSLLCLQVAAEGLRYLLGERPQGEPA